MKSLKYSNLNITTILLLALMISNDLHAQNNSEKSITTATILSAACPGLGQLYNKKYWKIPVLYASLGTIVYYYVQNNQQYHNYKSAYIAEIDNNINTINNTGYNATNLIQLQDQYRDNRDLSAFLLALLYTLNIVDACVDAHLLNYNVNDNLSLYLKPAQSKESVNLCLKLNLQ
tara:strand:+ start:1958 stop:2482 length:525 start_codon:yes stop_codon:yes gene_type:complete